MKTIDMTGKTVDDAVKNALNELKVTEDKIDIEVLDKGSKGLFNFIGGRPARIKVTVKRDCVYEAKSFLKDILDNMGIKADIQIKEEENTLKIHINGPDMGILIGYRGETLDALQYLVSLTINKDHSYDYKRVILDTENYRKKREETLKRLAIKISNKAIRTGRVVKLEPMNPYERRIIHSVLQNSPDVKTYSEGEEPYRRVIVDLKKA